MCSCNPLTGHVCGHHRCRSTVTDRDDEHRLYECVLKRGHPGSHTDGDSCHWTAAPFGGDAG
jgi:hypothetical protein